MSRELTVGMNELVLRERGRVLAREAFAAQDGALDAALQRMLPQRPVAPIRAIISAGHARMILLPWLPQLTRRERWNSLAASRFEQTFGESPDGWLMRVAEDLPPRTRLAAAIPQALLRSLQAAAKLRAVRIGLLDTLGRLLEREPGFSGCLAQVEGDCACLLMLWCGCLRRVRARRFEAVEDLITAARAEWIAVRGPESDGVTTGSAVAVLGGSMAASLAAALGCSRVLELA